MADKRERIEYTPELDDLELTQDDLADSSPRSQHERKMDVEVFEELFPKTYAEVVRIFIEKRRVEKAVGFLMLMNKDMRQQLPERADFWRGVGKSKREKELMSFFVDEIMGQINKHPTDSATED
jgi:hypothetical protein